MNDLPLPLTPTLTLILTPIPTLTLTLTLTLTPTPTLTRWAAQLRSCYHASLREALAFGARWRRCSGDVAEI